MTGMEIPDYVRQGVICLACGGAEFAEKGGRLDCGACGEGYPVIEGIPVLVRDGNGIFRQADFLDKKNLFFDISRTGLLLQRISRLLPGFATASASRRNFARLAAILAKRPSRPRVLIVGGSINGEGIEPLLNAAGIDILESDVSFGPRTAAVLDAHHIPYAEASFDAVVSQAVLEHVVDPVRCVEEFHRVLKPDGILYAETPFMQQVHGGAYDFTRFTHAGHRRLFRRFAEISSGAISGPGTALAWSYEYLLISLFGYGKRLRLLAKGFARFTGFWLKYLDVAAAPNPASLDAASGLWFLGRKSDSSLTDQELIAYYHRSRLPSKSQSTEGP